MRTMKYFNNLTEPNGQLQRVVNITLDRILPFQPCTITVDVLNIPDPPVIHLPEGLVH